MTWDSPEINHSVPHSKLLSTEKILLNMLKFCTFFTVFYCMKCSKSPWYNEIAVREAFLLMMMNNVIKMQEMNSVPASKTVSSISLRNNKEKA